MNDSFHDYLCGEKLYGDDFSLEQIEEWFADEEEGYAALNGNDLEEYKYGYHALNYLHGIKFIKNKSFNNTLGFGSAYGDELKPLINKIDKITIIDPSEKFSIVNQIYETPCEYKKPNSSGELPFKSNSFDLISCLGVMHHIPNVTFVINECYRCLNDGGVMLIREPITSMGDWRHPRYGLTKRERGIPRKLFNKIIVDAGFTVVKKSLCVFPPVCKAAKFFNISAYNNKAFTWADKFFSYLFSWNIKYHRINIIDKFAPSSEYYVLKK